MYREHLCILILFFAPKSCGVNKLNKKFCSNRHSFTEQARYCLSFTYLPKIFTVDFSYKVMRLRLHVWILKRYTIKHEGV